MHVPAASPFFDRTYREAFGLLVEARNYMAYAEGRDRSQLALLTRLELSCETMRVTSRLTQVMAWLLMQRAVHCGELSLEEACAEENRLAGEDVCLEDTADENAELPPAVRSLLNRSLSLYQRVLRLSDMVTAEVGQDRVIN